VTSKIGDSPAWLPAAEIARRVSAGDLDPHAVVRAHLGTIDRFDSRIHAYIHVDTAAQPAAGPFAGVTLAVKDSQPVAGMPWTYGTPSWRDRIAHEDAVPVARARSAGMAVLGKTNLPELAASIGTTNTLFPPTHNPWRQGITPGGSSGGSAFSLLFMPASTAMRFSSASTVE
jgi:Asp-tRNA(Asn)/Glu-tRNA(Gln) amidotransferase A subunit family amidase